MDRTEGRRRDREEAEGKGEVGGPLVKFEGGGGGKSEGGGCEYGGWEERRWQIGDWLFKIDSYTSYNRTKLKSCVSFFTFDGEREPHKVMR